MSVVSPHPARMLDRYVMLETLGKGGFSKVKLGLDPSTSPPTRVALKVLKQSSLSSSSHSAVEAVRREIHAMTVVQHRHVLRMRDVKYDVSYPKKSGASYPVVLIVLDLALGGELFDVLAYTGAFDEVLARTYFHQLVDAVGCCHQLGICHRDLKPENLLLDDHFALLVSDFGLSHTMTDEGAKQLLYTTCGTMAYIAPEVLAGRRKGYDGAAADVWSCGVILFILVASFPPFQQPGLEDWWYNKLATGRPHLFWAAHVRSVPFSEGLQSFLTKLLEVDPAKRLTVAEMLQDEWFCGETLSAERLQAAVRTRKEAVDVRKMQERAERDRQRRQQEAAQRGVNDFPSSRFLSDDDDAYRAYDGHADSTSDQLPPTQPAMALGTLDGAAGGEEGLMAALQELEEPAPAKRMSAVHSRLFSRSVAPSSPPQKAPAPVPVYDAELTVPTLTLLSSSLPLTELHSRLMSLLSLHRFAVKHNAQEHRYKATTQTLMGDVVLTCQLWRRPEGDSRAAASDELLLEFRRRAGDSGQYRELFTGLLVEMTTRGLIASAPSG